IKLNSNVEHRIRAIAGIGVAVLLLAQTAGAAHFHSFSSSHQTVSTTALAIDDGLCGLCMVRFHSPLAFAIAPYPEEPARTMSQVLKATRRTPSKVYRSYQFGRAPPAQR